MNKRPTRTLFCALALLAACGPKVRDDGDDGGDTSDAVFERECRAGCTYTEGCAPDEFATLFADVDECTASCQMRYGACVDEARVYFDCVAGSTCDIVAQLLVEGPMTTACGPAFDGAEQACGR